MSQRYSRRKAARELDISESSFDMLRRRGLIKGVRQGRNIYFLEAEIRRLARLKLPSIWPPKQNGKTTRHFAPAAMVSKKPPIKAELEQPPLASQAS